MRTTVVIGANFGDEGKGKVVDYLCSINSKMEKKPIVVRFTGGAQAGHTVDDGNLRHVFHHFGSGTLCGCATYLSEFFIANPMLWEVEWQELLKARIHPSLYADPFCAVTTPYDMIINQALERSRHQEDRHGSVGVGINETIKRCENPNFATRISHLENPKVFYELMQRVAYEYYPLRLKELDLKLVYPPDDFIPRFMSVASAFRANVRLAYITEFPEPLVFEGAQGLMLDRDSDFFPHVTNGKTGLHNAAILIRRLGIPEVDVVYVTRTYMTRHGAGPFPTEDPHMSFHDATNVPHDFQGTLRFGRVNLGQFAYRVNQDLKDAIRFKAIPHIAVNCIDQYGNHEFANSLADSIGAKKIYYGMGANRSAMGIFAMKDAA